MHASIALRKWGFASLITLYKPHILYKMRDSPWALGVYGLNQNRTCRSGLGQRRKGTSAVTLGTTRHGLGSAITSHYLRLDAWTFPIHAATTASAVQAGAEAPRPPTANGPIPASLSNPPIIWTPVLDRLLDVLPRQLLLQRAFHQLRNLRVRGEAQRNQLRFAQFGNPGS